MAQPEYPQIKPVQQAALPTSPSSGDKTMGDAADTQGVPPSPKATQPPGQADGGGASSDGDGTGKSKVIELSKKQRATVNRVLNCPEFEYYQILGVEDSANKETISKAYKKLSILTHPDRSKDPDATRAFQSKSNFCLS
jgi:hypothetical protein